MSLVLNSAVYTFGDLTVAIASGLFLLPLLTRVLGRDDYGLYSTLMTVISILSVIFQFGLISAVGRYYPESKRLGHGKDFTKQIWLIAAVLWLSVGAGASALLWLEWEQVLPGANKAKWFLWVIFTSSLSFPAAFFPLLLRLEERPYMFVAVQLVATSTMISSTLFLVKVMHYGITGALISLLGSLAIASISGYGAWRYANREKAIGPSQLNEFDCVSSNLFLKESVKFGLWMMLGTLCYLLIGRIQILVLQYHVGLGEAGAYNIGLTIGSIVIMVSNAVAKAWQPRIYASPSEEDAKKTIGDTFRVVLLVIVTTAMALGACAEECVGILAGKGYESSVVSLRLCAIANMLYSLAVPSSAILLFHKRAAHSQFALCASAVVNIALLWLLASRWGVMGAGISMVISCLVYAVANQVLANRFMEIREISSKAILMSCVGLTVIIGSWAAQPVYLGVRIAILVAGILIVYRIALPRNI